MNKLLFIFLIFIAAFSIYGIATFQPEFIVIFALLLIIVGVTIVADLIEKFFPKSKAARLIRKIEQFLFYYAG